jgi:PilZ domain
MAWCEIVLSTPGGATVARGSVADLSEGGIKVLCFPPPEITSLEVGQELQFTCVIPTGKISGSTEISRKDVLANTLGLRFTRVDGDNGLENLMVFLKGWLAAPSS